MDLKGKYDVPSGWKECIVDDGPLNVLTVAFNTLNYIDEIIPSLEEGRVIIVPGNDVDTRHPKYCAPLRFQKALELLVKVNRLKVRFRFNV